MLKRKSARRAPKQEAPRKPAATPNTPSTPSTPTTPSTPRTPSTPAQEYAKLGADAPIAWPAASGRRVPVTGQLSPHAAAALKRMGITKD